MKETIKNIESGKGLGAIRFGMDRSEIKKLLGEPDDIEVDDLEVDPEAIDESEAWHYDEHELSLAFDQEEGWRLVTISVTSDSYLLKGKKLIGKSLLAVTNELKEWGVTDLELEDLSTEEFPDHKMLTVYSLGINFWFDKEVLSEIQWGPLFSEDEEIIWPVD